MRRIVTFSHILCLISTVRPERWKVSIKTGTDFGAGTDATVRITVYGIHGSSPRTELNNPGNDFQNGDYDHYYVNGNIGKPYKVKIENDGRHVASKWQLNYIILSYGGRSYTFHCNCWIDDSHRDLKPQECKSSITNCRSVDRCFLCSRCEDGFSGTGKEVCRDIDECASNPCQNGGTCHNLRNRYSCSCWSGVTGVNCQHCPPIAFCQTLQCARGENICGKCNDQGVDKLHSLYWPVDKNKRCEATCSWKDNWCWPGRCTNNLESTCICQEDFQPSSSNPAKCDLKKTASLVTCTIGSESSGGDVTNSSSSGKDCFTEQDAFMKFQPKYLSMKFITQISVHVKNPKPAHIFESSFGIVDSKATIVKISKSGNDEHQIITIEKSQWCNKHISDDRPWPATPVSCTANVPLSQVLRNGEQICVIFDAFSGGFMKTIDFGNTISDPHIFKQTKASNRVCLRFDNAAPEHCSYSKICADEPIQILHRVTTEGIFDVLFSGWRDPIPSHGKPEQASGISYYEISLHDIKVVDDNTLRMNEGPLPGSTQKVKATTNVHSLKLHLPKEPALYGVSLDVVDNVGNSRRARRFVLYDNSSSVEINGQHRLFVKSGNVKTNYTWQVHLGDICLSWRDRYYNSYHKGNNLLRKILPDHNNFYMGVYEQYTGVIPVNGTVNVDGIVKYKYNWRLNSGNYSWEIPIPNVLDQGFCRNLNPRDGDTFTFQITPTDINGRELTELITVYIDSSIPEINNLGLNKDGHNLLYVHNSTDLSLMKVEFHAEDIHSGLFNIAWLLGTHPNGRDVGSGSLAVQEMPGSKVCPSNTDCYCPNVGVCERSLYSVSFNGLVEKGTNDGKHNREYYFTLIVTNNARLVNIHRVDILLDDSPPVAGVVMEGPPSEKDIDYTSSNDVEVHWKGFIDHESGIRLYVVGISDHCQSLDEIRKNSTSLISKTLRSDHLSTIFKLPQEGKYFFSVFAYNNAMEPSNIVCTDGVVLDKTPPLLSEFVLHGASAKDIVACFNMNPRLILENITSVNIHKSDMCLKFCRSSKAMIFLPNLPNVPAPYNDTDFANHICSHQRQYSSDWFIYLPSDQIQLSWNVSDDESQIEDVLVGFSSDISETTSPDIKDFVSAQTLKSYINHHEGLDRGVPFYVVIKAVNKANLETVVTYGPVIIDLTPPQYAGGLHTTSNDDDFYVTWNNNTFQEMEQKESIDTILFRFAYENGQYVTPHYQAAILYNCPLNKSVSCFKFPLRRIQVQDAENTMNFYCELYVYNTAGLYLTVKTQTFQVPSRFPPGDGVVSDVDPDYTSENADIDFQFNNSRACVTWKGFRHHKSIHFYVGLRSLERLDNVVELTRVNSTTYHCFENLNLIHSTRYYFTVKAVCSGGTRTSFSDGFTVIDHDQTLSSVTVSDGKKCNDTHLIRKLPITLKQNAPLRFEVKFNLSVDLTYTLTLSCCSDSNIIITSDDILVEKLRGVQANSQIWAMRSLSLRRPFIVIENKNTSSSECTCIMSLLPCPVKASYQSNSRQYTGHVDVDGELIKPFISHYEVALFSSSIGQHEELNMIVPYRTIFQNNFTITDVHLQESRVYQSSVRVCFDNICLPPVLSKGIVLQASPSSPGKIEGSLGVYGPNCTKLSALVQPFRCSAEVDAQFHLWSLSTEPDGSSLIMGWLPLHSKEFEDMKIEYCQKLPVYPHRPMYLCVKGICHSGVSSTKCTELGHESNGNEYSKYVLYEFDAWMKETPRIKSSIYSLNLGSILSLLHTKELDFCTSDIVLAGAIPYASDREIDWFLMEIDRIPGQPCQDDMLCKTHLHTNEGFVKFPRTVLKPNTKYFICASSNATVVQREKFSEYLEEFSLCGNGFIIDNDPPRLGRVDILQDVPGFITSSSELLVKWSDFSDIEQHLDTGLISGIKNYLYAIGTHSHGEDVVPFTFANTETSMTVRNLTLRAGAIYYATVKAVDYAGHETTAVSDGVICDTTPPVKGHISVGNALLNISFISVNNFEVHLDGFEDNESGIAEFKIGIGSSPNTTDTIPLFPVDGLSALISKNKNMIDGHHYFVIAKITNNAGLSTSMSSAAFIFDSSPPTGGIVKDGPRNKTFELDYQEDTLFLYAHWDGFKDQHSNILHYAVGVGTTPYTSDIEEMVEVGLTTEHFWHSLFIPGTKYYVTVKACNGAGLCTSVSSDGIIMDNSAPVSGLIHVGLSDRHQHFYGHRSVFSMQWVGFQDPHSDISHFEWCLGSEPGLCDLHQVENCLLSQSIVKSGLLLPLNSNIYAMVRAVNNVGLSTESFSDKFQIDITPPSVIKTPKFELNGMDVSSKENTQWDNSLLRLSWKFEDLESPILKHILLLRSHKNGKVVTQTTTCGSEEKVTILFKEGKLLDDGSTYTAWVTACNAAGLCTTSNSSDILIDSTPPHLGGFTKDMTWKLSNHNGVNTTEVNLSWHGFEDAESGLNKYLLSVSRTFSGTDLSSGIVSKSPSGMLDGRESMKMYLSEKVESSTLLVLSIWAENGVGLRSRISRVTVTLVSRNADQTEGILEIQRHSCTSHYCNGDCTCAVVGRKCDLVSDISKCHDLNNNSSVALPSITVNIGNIEGKHQHLTASASCITGHWLVSKNKTEILRYEWSIGVHGQKPGDGVFDIQTENTWYDVGMDTNVTFCFNNGKTFIHRTSYVLYVKAWYSESTFSIYSSEPVLVDRTDAAAIQGSSVMESIDQCQSDVEYTNYMNITICWRDVFSEQQGSILHYELMGGTSPYGSDFLPMTNLGHMTQYKINPGDLHPGTRYYFTVMSTNSVGLVSSLVSDGVVIDLDEPVEGVVYNTISFRNVHFQSSADTLGVSWEGFVDHQSYIKSYNIQLLDTVSNANVSIPTSVGSMKNSILLKQLPLENKGSYRLMINAHDAAGHISKIVYSPKITIDTTPPVGYSCQKYERLDVITKPVNASENQTHNGLIKIYHGSVSMNSRSWVLIKLYLEFTPQSKSIILKLNGKMKSLYLATNANQSSSSEYLFLAEGNRTVDISLWNYEGHNILYPLVSIERCSKPIPASSKIIKVQQIGPLTLSVSYFIDDAESGIKNFFVGVGTTKGGFQLNNLSAVGRLYHTVIAVDAMHGSPVYITVIAKNNADQNSIFKAGPIILDHTKPYINQLESTLFIRENVKQDIGIRYNNDSLRTNDTELYNDTYVPAHEEINQTLNSVQFSEVKNASLSRENVFVDLVVHWNSVDPESGIEFCECSLGTRPGISNLYRWIPAKHNDSCHFHGLQFEHGTTVYPAVRCTNTVQLKHTEYGRGVMISYEKPDIQMANIDVIRSERSISPELQSGGVSVQSDKTSIQYQWHGFQDDSRISFYTTRIMNKGQEIQTCGTSGITYCRLNNRYQEDTPYSIEIKAINLGNITSDAVNATVIISHSSPSLTERWSVGIKTGTSAGAGTGAAVRITVYGIHGSTPRTRLDDHFENGDYDHYYVNGNIGKPYQVKIENDGAGLFSSWQLDYIILSYGGRSYRFNCNCWIDNSHRDLTPNECKSSIANCRSVYRCFLCSRCEDGFSGSRTEACKDIDECASNPCQNGGTCHNQRNRYSCSCWPGVTGVNCQHCPPIDFCETLQCARGENICGKCNDQGVNKLHSLYWPVDNNKKCEATCSWKDNWCWPGRCSNDLESTCICGEDFQPSSSNPAKCDLKKTASLVTCTIGSESSGGEVSNSSSSGKDCFGEQDAFMKFQPKYLSVKFITEISVHVKNPKPAHILESNFGIVDSNATIVKISKSGNDEQRIKTIEKTEWCNKQIKDNKPLSATPVSCTANVPLSQVLQNGEWICVIFDAFSGGFMKTVDFENTISDPHIFKQTKASNRVCLRFDNAAPEHCSYTKICADEPIQILHRVTTEGIFDVSFSGWRDPIPSHGKPDQASGISYYEISLHDIKVVDDNTLRMNEGPLPGSTQKVKATTNIHSLKLHLPKEPALYGVNLDVVDNVGNFRKARRFVLYDNSSSVEINGQHRLFVKSGNVKTNYTWQVHLGDICLSWRDRYYNSYHKGNNLLRKILPDHNNFYMGVYEQYTGVIPVNGTVNVDGIVKYKYNWRLNSGNYSWEIPIPNVLDQGFCRNLNPRDGDTFTFQITPTDINGRELTELITVYIDSSIPEINNLGLSKDGHNLLYVHNSTNLSLMKVEFHAEDIHSGLFTIAWLLGRHPNGRDVGSGSLAVQEIPGSKVCPSNTDCYCPNVGVCERSLYSVSFNGLVANGTNDGKHNREYYFTLIVTNNARLVNIHRVDILLDDSPPVAGVVMEGPPSGKDIDYTSSNDVEVHWKGFIDHESGIRLYVVGVSDHCQSLDEIRENSTSLISKTVRSDHFSTIFKLPQEGKYFFSVFAYNNAMEPSNIVCTDGVVLDKTPPLLRELILHGASAKDIVACFNMNPRLILENITSVNIHKSDSCLKFCRSSKAMPFLPNLPNVPAPYNDTDFANHICSHQRQYSSDWFIYIPSDQIRLSWNVSDHESQIEDVLVGFSSDVSETTRPDIKDFVSAQTLKTYINHHEGLDRGVPFYVVIKAVNKANLETVVTYGPVIIDQTPPQYAGGLHTISNDDDFYVIWNNNTFQEMEQKESIDTILFRFAYENGQYVTPHYQATILYNCPLNKSVSCFKFPLRRIQVQDAENTMNFYCELYVYNTAGLYLTVKTQTFHVPSRFPPGDGVVSDVDPDYTTGNADVDFQFNVSRACVTWKGFRHHRSIQFYVGLGSLERLDNVVELTRVNSTTSHCFQNLNLIHSTRYYFTVKAVCSGGTRTSFSDGFTVIDHDQTLSSVTVSDGKKCNDTHLIRKLPITLKQNAPLRFEVKFNLSVDLTYTLTLSCCSDSNIIITSDDILVEKLRGVQANSQIWAMRSLSLRRPFIVIENKNTSSSECTCIMSLLPCPVKASYQSNSRQYTGHVDVDDELIKPFISHYEVALFSSSIGQHEELDMIVPYRTIFQNNFTITDVHLQESRVYQSSVRVCFDNICLPPVLSKGIVLQASPSSPGKIEGSLGVYGPNCTKLSALVQPFRCSAEVDAQFHLWSLSTEPDGSSLIMGWLPLHSKEFEDMKIEYCQKLPVYPHRPMYLCVKGICHSGVSSAKCTELGHESNGNEYSKYVLYEFDAWMKETPRIKSSIYSLNLGSILSLLHTKELDFCTSDIVLAGAIPYASDREIDWFLMEIDRIPGQTCQDDMLCKTHLHTNEGFVKFPRTVLKPNTKYFICASSNATVVQREKFSEYLEEFSLCGNGFIIDNDPPRPGRVDILQDVPGFITSSSELLVKWSDFSDIEQHLDTGLISGIKNYLYAIGTHSHGEDVVPFSFANTETSMTVRNLTLRGGAIYYATVKAVDYAGHETTAVSDGVICDTTPPVKGHISVGNALLNISFISVNNFEVHLDGFEDNESGIAEFKIGIGSSPNTTDTTPLFPVDGLSALISKNKNMIDGHHYFVIAKTTNNAGLSTSMSSAAFIFDSSPPTGGIVKDGPRNKTFELDYQEDTLFLYAHWDGFKDQHSNILHYAVGVGTTPYTSDIEEMVEVGLTTEHFWHSLFIPGTKYYVTVKACNGAGLCTSVSSDGIIMDNSAPVSGLIHVGLSDRHQHFYGHRSVFSMQWVGFQDPHSDISHFEWCLGSEPGLCDLHQVENCLLSQSIVKSGLLLPLNSNIYAMVRAVNNVGLSTESFSDKFQIDITPPSVIKTPKFELNGMDVSSKENTQWDNSLLRLSWKFEDLESPILKHILLLRSHKNGKVVTQTTTCGSEEKVTILFKEGKLLDDGSTYTAWVTACNAAGLCTTSNSSEILIDSTPPHLGGFTKDMTWKLSNHNGVNTTEVNLSWHGFEDAESGLNKYLLSVSRTFSGTDLSSGIVSKSPSGMLDGRESMKMYLSEKVDSSTLLVLSIWAENGVGLRSRISRVTVTLVSRNADQTEGILEIQRHSCTSHYCNGDCTCAVVGRKCDLVSDISKCHDLSNNSSVALPSITVNIGNIEGKHQHLTASASCITGHWLVSKNKTEILRYEWSIGVHGQKPGDGVFDIQTENTWYDVGMDTNVTFCFNNGKTFIHRTSYVLYVKAWYSESTFSIYSSEPVLVDRTDAAAIQGSSVMESIDQCQSDVEYTNYMNITICWRDVFSEQQGSILHYELMGGTSPYGSDFLPMTNLGHMTQYKINPGDLQPGTRYYFTVMSTNSVGLVSSLVSDGVVIDLDEPVEGVVYNTISFRNVHFQSSADTLGVSWEGFVDHQSYIKSYNIQLLDTVSNANVSIPTSVGSMENSILLKQLPLENKGSYRLMINAHDAAGHISKIVYSPKITIDTTPPVGYSCQKYERLDVITKPVNASVNQTHNGLIKIYHGSVSMNSRSWVLIKLYLEFTPQSKSIILKLNGKMKSLYLATNANQSSSSEYLFLAEGNRTVDISLWNYEGHNILYPLVSIERCSKPIPASSKIIKVQQIGPLTLSVSYFIDDAESGIKDFFVGVGTTKGGFQLKNLSAVGRLYHTVIAVEALHGSPVYITVIAKNNADQNSIFKAGPIILDHTKPNINQLESTLFIHENVKQDMDIHCNNDSLRTNDTELYNDTYVTAYEEINQTLNSVQFSEVKNASLSRENVLVDLVVHWNSVDPESGIEFCECSLGTRPGISNLYRWIPAKHNESCHFHGLQFKHGTTVYPAVRCTNTVQLKHTEYGRGVMISYEKPDILMANIDVITSERSISPELQSGGVSVQSDKTSIQYQWHGFQDDSKISFYTTRIMNKGQEIQTCGTSGITYCRLNNRYQADTPYSIEIKAINLGNITSDAVNATVIISHSSPSLTGSRVVISKTGNMMTVSWSNVFQPNPYGLLTYQVFLGSQKGLTDLLQPVSTTKKSIDVNVDYDVMEVFVVIYATSPTGTIGVYRDNLTL